MSRIFATGSGGQNMVIEDVTIETETSRGRRPTSSEVLVFSVRPKAREASRCSRCRKRCPGYDGGDRTRRWRTLDVGKVVVAHVPWARPAAKHTWAFEDTCAWLAAHAAMRCAHGAAAHRLAHGGRDRDPGWSPTAATPTTCSLG